VGVNLDTVGDEGGVLAITSIVRADMVILAGRRDELKIEMEVERIHKIYHTANSENLAFLTPQIYTLL
jgi:N-formylglutamate amidohydrolase